MNSAHRLILVFSYSCLQPIKTDEERQNNWTKVSGSCRRVVDSSCAET